jgi:hypothetical protein
VHHLSGRVEGIEALIQESDLGLAPGEPAAITVLKPGGERPARLVHHRSHP